MLFLQVESGDLIAYGLIPEFVGRFPILVSLSSLSEDQLVEVIIHAQLYRLHVSGLASISVLRYPLYFVCCHYFSASTFCIGFALYPMHILI